MLVIDPLPDYDYDYDYEHEHEFTNPHLIAGQSEPSG